MVIRSKPSVLRRTSAVLLTAALVLLCAASAHAAAISYSLMLCESLDLLKDPTNKTLAMNVAWKPQHTLMLERTMPYMELVNTSEEAEITQLSLTIGDTSKNFDWGKLVEASPGVAFSLITPDAVAGGVKSDTLTIQFTGLVPGEFVRFRTGLSPDDPGASMIMDYRMVLFNLNGSDSSSNSTVTVDFEGSEGTDSLVQQLPNFTSGGMPTFTSMAFPDHYMDMVMPFTVTDSGLLPPQETEPPLDTPEPASIVLLGGGLLGLFAWRIRLGRKRNAGMRI
jgi:PEP-CTERM motif